MCVCVVCVCVCVCFSSCYIRFSFLLNNLCYGILCAADCCFVCLCCHQSVCLPVKSH